ncbi:peptide chain release factor N(5)-glutamine methyltransferase [soil metagenome]
MTLDVWLRDAERRLAEAGIEEPRAEARLLAAHALGRSKAWVMAHGDERINSKKLEEWLQRRERREPLAHLIGVREFYGRPFRVTPATLVPRSETEVLVELALELAPMGGRVLDVGTGTGCIGITLALERPDLAVTLLDISPEALAVARENAEALGANVETVEGDLFPANREPRTANFDLVVSNPPYIAAGESLMPEVGRYEPSRALFGGPDGLDFYRRLASETATFAPALAVEIGYDQSESVPALFEAEGWSLREVRSDLGGISRALAFSKGR